MSEFLDRLLGEEIQLELHLMEAPCVVLTDRTQLENAILNLCVNARDAVPQGGKLTISARTSRLAESSMGHASSDREADYVELVVTDTGTGIPESIQKQIFEPFFTTKEKHQGTGSVSARSQHGIWFSAAARWQHHCQQPRSRRGNFPPVPAIDDGAVAHPEATA